METEYTNKVNVWRVYETLGRLLGEKYGYDVRLVGLRERKPEDEKSAGDNTVSAAG